MYVTRQQYTNATTGYELGLTLRMLFKSRLLRTPIHTRPNSTHAIHITPVTHSHPYLRAS